MFKVNSVEFIDAKCIKNVDCHTRLVAQGYNQQEGIDYDETYALVASAFLNDFIIEEVYVAQPPGLIDFEKPNHVYKLKKALYGLKQAPKAWFKIALEDPCNLFIEKVAFCLGLRFALEALRFLSEDLAFSSEEDNDPEQAQRDKDMHKNLALIAKYFKKIYKPINNNLKTSSNSRNKNVDATPRYKNDIQSGQFRNQRTVNVAGARENVGSLPKRVKDFAYHKEKMLLCKQAKQGVLLQDEQYDWLADIDKEIDEQELEAHYSYMSKIQEVPTADTGTDSEPVEQNEQNDVESDDERVTLANLIDNLKLDVDENKKIQKQLKKPNTTLAQELKECKTILVKTSKTLVESNSVRDSYLIALQNKQTEFENYKVFNDRTIDYDKIKHKLNEALGQLAQKDIKIKEVLKMKAYEISVVKEKHDELMKQSLLTKSHYEGLVKQKTKAQSKMPCLYAFPCDQSTHANRLILDGEETLALERESRSKLNKYLVRPYDYTTLNSLYEIFKPPTQEFEIQLAYANEIRKKIWRKYFVKYKPNIYKNIGFLPVLKSISKSRQAYNVMTNNINHFKEIVDNAWIKHSKDQFRAPTAQDMEIMIQTCLMPLAIKTKNDSFLFVRELKQEMHADLKYVESLEKEIDQLESDKAEFSNMYDMILQEFKECDCLAQKLSNQTESVSKEVHFELLKRFAKVEKLLISLEIALQKRKEQVKDDTVWNEKASNVFRKEREQYFEIQDLKEQLQDKNIAISELKKLIEKGKGKYVDTKFDKPSVVQQPNAQRIPKPSVLGKPAPFSNSFEVSEGLSKPVTAQNLPQTGRKVVCNTNVLKSGMYQIENRSTQTSAPQVPQTVRNTNPRMSTSTGVNHKTNVSRPQHKSNQLKDKVMPNNSQVKPKKTQVEVHPGIPSVSNKMKSVTACKDSLNSRTLNVNAVCATCNKCLVDSNHFACVTKMLNNVNARTKKPNVVPISTRKPKAHTNKSGATPYKKKVASKSNNQKPQSQFRMLYEKISKTWKWWIEQQSPSGYKWVPKTKMQWDPICQLFYRFLTLLQILQLILFIVDSGCTKHMTGNLKLLCNFVEKFSGTVRSGNDQFAPILSYGDLVQGNFTINRVYYVEGLNHNLFSVGQFYDADLEVAFRKSTCFVRDL
nr:copia protein [Tanacetum cinerariifolium]